MFIKLIADDITAGFTELQPRGLPKHDPVVGIFKERTLYFQTL